MRRARPVSLAVFVLVAIIAAGGALTWVALESGEVAVLRTHDASDAWHETRVWIADEGGFAWLEAATPEREWYLRLLAEPRGEIVRSATTHAFQAMPHPGDEGHAKIRRLLRVKYGWRDRWVGLFQDTSRSIAVRLDFGAVE